MWHFQLQDGTGVVDIYEDTLVDRRIENRAERVKCESDEFLAREQAPPAPPYVFGTYHMVVGKRLRDGVEPVCIRPMSDMNGLTTHNLECIFQFIRLQNKGT